MLAIALLVPGAAVAAMYKWVDDKGVVHYGDQVPPDAVNKGSVQLSPQGITIRKVAPAAPQAPRETEQGPEREAAREQAAKDQAASARRDRALLNSYTTASDIDLAKTRAIQTLRAALQSAQSYSTQLTKRRAALAERKAAYGSKPVPADVEHELEAIGVELERQSVVIAQKNKQLVEVAAKYDADKERWQALNGDGSGKPPPPAQDAAPAPAARSASRK